MNLISKQAIIRFNKSEKHLKINPPKKNPTYTSHLVGFLFNFLYKFVVKWYPARILRSILIHNFLTYVDVALLYHVHKYFTYTIVISGNKMTWMLLWKLEAPLQPSWLSQWQIRTFTLYVPVFSKQRRPSSPPTIPLGAHCRTYRNCHSSL